MKPEHQRQLLIFGVVTLLVSVGGVVLVLLGFGRYVDSRAFVAMATPAPGKVVGFETYDAPGGDSRDDIHYAMVVYKTRGGREIKFRGPSRDGLVRLKRGDDVRVLYDPSDPKKARVDSFMGLWFAATMLWLIGGGALIIPPLTMWQAWKWAKRQDGAYDA